MIARELEGLIRERLFRAKAIVVIGPRQVGKTTLLRKIVSPFQEQTLWINGDDPHARQRLAGVGIAELEVLIGSKRIVVVDEAQRISDIGLTLKMVVDHFPGVQLLVTGSSSLDLAGETREPLTGRKFEFFMYPLSCAELFKHFGEFQERPLLEHRLVFGQYPDVVMNPGHEREILSQLSSSYLYKDLFIQETIRKPVILEKLLQALALQVGQEVVYRELGQLIAIDPVTVERYIDLLEKAFVVFKLPSLSRNARNEIKKGRKIYFYDNGVRNAIINNFNPPQLRQDIGALWENFLISERRKTNEYRLRFANLFFWRTHTQQEVDYIEERDGRLYAYEFKWNPRKSASLPNAFARNYPGSIFHSITPENFLSFVQD